MRSCLDRVKARGGPASVNHALNECGRVREIRILESKRGVFVRKAGARMQESLQRKAGQKANRTRPRSPKHAKIALAELRPVTDASEFGKGLEAGPHERIYGVFQAYKSTDVKGPLKNSGAKVENSILRPHLSRLSRRQTLKAPRFIIRTKLRARVRSRMRGWERAHKSTICSATRGPEVHNSGTKVFKDL